MLSLLFWLLSKFDFLRNISIATPPPPFLSYKQHSFPPKKTTQKFKTRTSSLPDTASGARCTLDTYTYVQSPFCLQRFFVVERVGCIAYSFSLCHSAICLRGALQTSFQCCWAGPPHRGPSSSLPITSFFVTRSQSRTRNSRLMFSKPSLYGTSNTKDSLKTGLVVRFFT